jgi:uncharacterized protein (TIGR00255 family)
MTGFGAAEGAVSGGWIRFEIRTVNHRHFNLATRLPGELAVLEGELRERLRREFDRGHVAVQARWTEYPATTGGFGVDLERARLVTERLRELQAALGLAGEVTVDMVVRQSDVISSAGSDAADVPWSEVEPIVAQAAAECRAMRAREGDVLVAELRHRLELLEGSGERVAARAPERLSRERDRLRAAVAELLDGKPADESRLAQEIAFQADRLDITEELVRFRAHLGAAREALAATKPAGKQLGFLAQELGREVNTMGAKANDAEITHEVVAMKGELEKLREQLENLE